MITLDERIAKTERLLRRLQDDQPYLRARLSALGAEHRQSASAFADRVRVEAEAELQPPARRTRPALRLDDAAARRLGSTAQAAPL